MKPVVFAQAGNEVFAKSIATYLHADLGEVIFGRFPDGETYLRIQSDVKNKKTIIVCTLRQPDEKILPLYFLAKTLKSLGADSICLVAPYLAYMRQDKVFNPGEGVTSEYFASLVSDFADNLITVDPHLHRRHSLSEIYSIPCKVIHASPLISAYIKDHISNPVIIGPDAESVQWVSEIAKDANAAFIVLEKTRLGDKEVKITIPDIGKFRNHTPVIVDDIISTANTMIQTVKILKNKGMKPAVCFGIHAIFAGTAFEELKDSGAGEIITCNTISHISNKIDICELLAKSI